MAPRTRVAVLYLLAIVPLAYLGPVHGWAAGGLDVPFSTASRDLGILARFGSERLA